MSIVGLIAMAAGSFALAMLPATFGIAGYVAALALLAPGYQLFQAANNTTVMMDVHADQRGVVSGLLNLSRNLGGITGASVMGAVFALASAGPWRSRRPIPPRSPPACGSRSWSRGS